jgi:hypothetical protein
MMTAWTGDEATARAAVASLTLSPSMQFSLQLASAFGGLAESGDGRTGMLFLRGCVSMLVAIAAL